MTIKIASLNSISIDLQEYGGKAHWLWRLHKLGYPVPYAFFLPAVKHSSDIDFSAESTKSLMTSYLQNMQNETGEYSVAVRSSATVEDSFTKSYAGHFKSKLGSMSYEEVQESITEVIDSLEAVRVEENVAMGVVVQKLVIPKVSGVIFSSDPLTNFKGTCVLSSVGGFGEALVSGKKPGTELVVQVSGDSIQIPKRQHAVEKDQVEELCRTAKRLEQRLRFPLDMEWCIDDHTGSIVYLQCRPATSTSGITQSLFEISSTNEDKIPTIVRQNDKLAIRLLADRLRIPLARSYLICLDLTGDSKGLPDLSSVKRSTLWNGYSTVLLYPEMLDGKVIRYFLGEKWAQALFLGCQRYAVRAYPEYDLETCVSGIAKMVGQEYWGAAIMLQEVYRAEYTGIARIISEDCLIEVARGFFVAKGIVPVSRYILDSAGELLHSKEVRQQRAVNILGGHIVEETIPEQLCLVSLDPDVLKRILTTFRPLWKRTHSAVEFGLALEDGALSPYLIDFVPVPELETKDASRILQGVVSKGRIRGKAVILQKERAKDSISFHYSNVINGASRRSGAHVVFADLPDISLLRLLGEYDEKKIGFVFREGSVLCHLSIVLRERGIPAVILGQDFPVSDGEMVTIDASTPSLLPDQRVRRD
jgi:hypothetical protein